MKKLTYILLFSGALLSCTKDFDEINTNPNAPTQADPQFLLTNVLYNAGNNYATDAWNAGNFLAQLTARFDFNEIDRYDIRTNTEYWNATYLLLNDVRTLQQQAATSNPHYEAVGLILRSFLAATLTDLWGDVPYSQAVTGDQFTPAYDRQQDIYMGPEGILASLRKAVDILDANPNALPVAGDILYQGNATQWVQLANSLRLRYLLRVSSQADVAAEMQQLVNEGRLFQSEADQAAIPFLSTAPNQWFVHNIREGDFANVRMSTTIDSVLTLFDDPRMQVWFKPTAASAGTPTPVYDGIPNGLGPASRSNFDLSEVSVPGEIFRERPDGVSAVFMSYSELQFILAGAAFRGLIAGDAQGYYEAGIRASFDYYHVPLPADYLTRPAVAYDANRALELILTQKWLAAMLVGYEAWFDFRRTGFPALQPAVDNTNNDVIPVRYRYPDSEKAINAANYQQAVGRMGGDTHNQEGWWEQ